jgi:hypothetical protein
MEHGPRRIMQMIRLGMADMAGLRNLSIAKGLATDKEAKFSRVFVEVLQRYGRMYEPEVLVRYYMSQAGVSALVKQAGLGLTMLRKGKIGLRPERINDTDELRDIAARIRSNGG